jgi:hypothetical protein
LREQLELIRVKLEGKNQLENKEFQKPQSQQQVIPLGGEAAATNLNRGSQPAGERRKK